MGYCSGWGSKQELCRHLLHADSQQTCWERSRGPIYAVHTALASCYRGNNFKGTLWAVWQWDVYHGNLKLPPLSDRFIACYVMDCQNTKYGREWGYKSMTEDMGPHVYSCPVGYLDMVPEGVYTTDPDWRKIVREVAARTAAKRAATRECRKHMYASRRETRKSLKQAREVLEARKHAG